jgi:hypothetical protein
LGYRQHTTPSTQAASGFVTITHPHHPLRGDRVQIIRIRRGPDPDLIVRLPNGLHVAVAMSWTDYAALPALNTPSEPTHLLAIDGLRRAADLVARLRQDGHEATMDGGTP